MREEPCEASDVEKGVAVTAMDNIFSVLTHYSKLTGRFVCRKRCSTPDDDNGDNAFHIAAETVKMIRENLDCLIVMLMNPDADIEIRNHRFEVGDWVTFKRTVTTPTYGWQGARPKSVGFVQSASNRDNLIVSFWIP